MQDDSPLNSAKLLEAFFRDFYYDLLKCKDIAIRTTRMDAELNGADSGGSNDAGSDSGSGSNDASANDAGSGSEANSGSSADQAASDSDRA
ncbi:MAG: hypothetical protein LBQ43_05250, partial [Holosporales bacterium]|nr:hypothetical protein [Holosporales bacterium]